MPDRVTGQFGMLQPIAAALMYLSDHHRMTLKGNIVINWIQKHQPSIDIWNTHLDHIFLSDLIVGDCTVPEYHPWYLKRIVRFLSRMGAFHQYIASVICPLI